MNVKQLATLKNAYDRRKELLEFEEELKKNPLQEGEYISLIDESNLDIKEKVQYREHIKTLRKNNMIIDDIPEPFNEFSKRVEADGFIPIKKSVMKQMNDEEFTALQTKKFALYNDMGNSEKIQHYTFRTNNGIQEHTGNGIGVVHNPTDDIEVVKNAQRHYKEAKDVIGKTLSEIEVNGAKYQDYRKIPD